MGKSGEKYRWPLIILVDENYINDYHISTWAGLHVDTAAAFPLDSAATNV